VSAALKRWWRRLRAFPREYQVSRIRRMMRSKPLTLVVETVNACNAACVFCGYPRMKRKKGVMSLEVFEKVLRDYSAMGGGALSLTPVVGDALLDPHLLERLRMLESYPSIDQVTLTTNAIALHKLSDDDVRYLLRRLFVLQLSIGGLDRDTYRRLYSVDRFDDVHEAMNRLVRLKSAMPSAAHLTFAFRTNDDQFETRHAAALSGFRDQGVHVSHISTYGNYSGLVKADEIVGLRVRDPLKRRTATCGVASTHMVVLWDGKASGCSCSDVHGDGLIVGDAGREPIHEIWAGKRRQALLDSFPRQRMAKLCEECSFYKPETDLLASDEFRQLHRGRKLPLAFYHAFLGG
jgi:hypothetical protein